jgi:hypothetical protein
LLSVVGILDPDVRLIWMRLWPIWLGTLGYGFAALQAPLVDGLSLTGCSR